MKILHSDRNSLLGKVSRIGFRAFSSEVYIWIILILLIFTALGATVLTTRLLGMQKRRYVSLQAKKQGLAQRQVAVSSPSATPAR